MGNDNLNVAEWVQYAQEDYNLAVTIVKTHSPYPVPIRIVCYQCQQSAEKILKAYMIAKEGERTKTHDLEKLLEQCARHSSDFSRFDTACATLSTYVAASRYPSNMGLTELRMKQAMRDAFRILEFVKSKLRELGVNFENIHFDPKDFGDFDET
jgi:HEPN domain-containing protein